MPQGGRDAASREFSLDVVASPVTGAAAALPVVAATPSLPTECATERSLPMGRARAVRSLSEPESLRLLGLSSFSSSVDRFLFAPLIVVIARISRPCMRPGGADKP